MEILNQINDIVQHKVESLRPIEKEHHFLLEVKFILGDLKENNGFFLHEYTKECFKVNSYNLEHILTPIFNKPTDYLAQEYLVAYCNQHKVCHGLEKVLLSHHFVPDLRYQTKDERPWVVSHGRPLAEIREELKRLNPVVEIPPEQEKLNTDLNNAVYAGDLMAVKLALKNGANINVQRKNAIYVCIIKEQLEIFQYLLENGLTPAYYKAIFDTALEEEANEFFKVLFQHCINHGFDMHYQDDEILELVCIHNNLEIVQYLVKHGFDLSNNESHCLISATANPPLIEFLIKNGANIDKALEKINQENNPTDLERKNLLLFYKNMLDEQKELKDIIECSEKPDILIQKL